MSKLLFLSLRNGEIGPDVAHAEYHDALRATGVSEVDMELRVIDSPDSELGPLDPVSGIIVGGCSLNVTNPERDAWHKRIDDILSATVNSGKPVFFVCFGISWLVDHLGGEVGRTHPEPSGPTTVNVVAEDALAGPSGTFTALTGHTENPVRVPDSLTVVATGPDDLVQMVRYGDRVWATQFHAEMDADAMRTRMDFFHDYGYFPAEEYARIVADLPNHDVSRANGLLRTFARLCTEGRFD
ncbi:gamma-glutamyl-gamma-aminobutyrate hydrolase family protein [Corynebacterium afermentans subsp. lipophilum]|uniref:glutamine amidotransferase-related protein n=1 Tax=Corynebacterium afermentans TaxID=38286 RepID=UPI00188B6A30|nr:gamma-glutamyl-gamma-aminobutyrate hydrolase family protein [Corynebacterium afermentans]MBF4546568.1 gamma-glutamyl-gamma-aminobutyrate hydrolase family protein [Corynebacterium afermentans subsp. lipophilum]WJY58930.1 GMP synthase [glutamine-hydrolyzing] [Corynebacterium afermentans subsp. lipophilum]